MNSSMNTHDAAGEDLIRIRATRSGGVITKVTIDLPQRAWMGSSVIGLTPEAAGNLLLEQASHSPRAHACAVCLAAAAAEGKPAPAPDSLIATERTLAAEAADSHLRRLLIDWPPYFGFEPRYSHFAEFHRRLTLNTDTSAEAAFALGGEILDLVAREMLAGFFNQIRMPHGIGEFIERLNAGGSLGTVLGELIALGASAPPKPRPVPLLGTLSAAAWANEIGAWPSADFVARPTYHGEAAETGPLARHAASPLVRLLLERGHRLSARLFAKAIEVGDCASRMRYPFTDDVAPLADAAQAEPGIGVARVETARGVLLAWVRVADGVIADCGMIPAGAWNFHPEGAFCREALCATLVPEDHDGALRRVSMLAVACDPSLPYRVEVHEAQRARKPA